MKIVVIGAGGWGTTLSIVLSHNGHDVTLWTHETALIEEINSRHTNDSYLSGIKIPENIRATDDPESPDEAELIVNAVPTQFIRSLYTSNKFDVSGKPLVNCAKGIERKTIMTGSRIFNDIADVDSNNFAVLTGPSHAEEVSRNLPTTIVAGTENNSLAEKVQDIFSTPYFRIYSSEDVAGCEIGGSLKNVIAIAAGIIDGLGMGDNTKAALITRGLAEIARLGVAHGAQHMTFSGLSGLGDLIVTCNSRHSRNRRVGEEIGKGHSLDDITSKMKMIAEGIFTTEAAYQLGEKRGVELPIIEEIYNILFEGYPPKDAIRNLMNRSSKREWWW